MNIFRALIKAIENSIEEANVFQIIAYVLGIVTTLGLTVLFGVILTACIMVLWDWIVFVGLFLCFFYFWFKVISKI